MIKKVLTILMLFATGLSFSQQQILDSANKLIEKRQYLSAYQLLNEADPGNSIPGVAIAKTSLVLEYYVRSVMHVSFALADLEPDQQLNELRSSEGNFDLFIFSPDTVLNNLIEIYPENYELHKSLGNFYHDVHLKYGSNWIIPDSMLVVRFMKNYGEAFENEVYDARSLYGLGYAFLLYQQYQQSIKFFVMSIELDPENPSAYYNLAYAFLYNNEKEKAIASALKAMELYQYAPYAAESARIAAVAYAEMDRPKKALEFYRKANEIYPDDYYTLRPLLAMEVQLGDTAFPRRTENFLALSPANPSIYQDLMHIYWRNGKQDLLINFLENRKNVYRSDTNVVANLHFFIGKIQHDKGDSTLSIQNFREARNLFDNVYQQEHDVFKVIDDYLQRLGADK